MPQYTNALKGSKSLYLRQHAHNPVFWEPWGEEAHARAKAEDRPIFLSIGYATCYWCHVMERDVFENPSIAAYLNEYFVNIKVDREEQPELDELYMTARQLMTQHGGWPNNLFLTPDLKPFYAEGTFGAEDAHGRPGFPRLLEWIQYRWQVERKQVEEKAEQVASLMAEFMQPRIEAPRGAEAIVPLIQELAEQLERHFDPGPGGFFRGAKFPQENFLLFLMGCVKHIRDVGALEMAGHTLFSMAAGGLRDHVGEGFHRYCIDRAWRVPHFEKMLYTQALLGRAYAELHRLTGNPYAADVAEATLRFALAQLRSPEGVFYSGIDAEVDEVEGAFYVWNAKELQKILSPEEAAFFVRHYTLADVPHIPGHRKANGQVIIGNAPLWEAAVEERQPYSVLSGMAGLMFNTLAQARAHRQPPVIDDKILTGWNGLMIEALARGSAVLGLPEFYEAAAHAARTLLNQAKDYDGLLMRVAGDPGYRIPATAEDYAYLIQGLLMLYRVNREREWLDAASSLLGQMDGLMRDTEGGGYFYTQARTDLLARAKTAEDSALPSPNAIMLHNFLDFYELTGERRYLDEADALARAFLPGVNAQALPEFSTFLHGCTRLKDTMLKLDTAHIHPTPIFPTSPPVLVSATMTAAEQSARSYDLGVHFDINAGWHINAADTLPPFVPTQIRIGGHAVETVEGIEFPPPDAIEMETREVLTAYARPFTARCRVVLKKNARPEDVIIEVTYHPCSGNACAAIRTETLNAS